jgi:excisionase family DNA binding protein
MSQRPVTPDPRYLTPHEAAEYLRLSRRTLEKKRIYGGGPRYHKFGRRVFYTLAELDHWAQRRTFDMTSNPDYPALPGCRS